MTCYVNARLKRKSLNSTLERGFSTSPFSSSSQSLDAEKNVLSKVEAQRRKFGARKTTSDNEKILMLPRRLISGTAKLQLL